MTFPSIACILLLSSKANVVFGSNIQGAELEQEQRKQQSTRARGLRSGEIVGNDASEEPMDDVDIVSELFNELDDDAYDLLASSYKQLSADIKIALLQVNPDLNEEDLVHAREAFMNFLDGDNDVPDAKTCSTSSEAEVCVNDEGAIGYYMYSEIKNVCVEDTMTIDKQASGYQCGCYRGVCPSACHSSHDCSDGDGSLMCLEQSNYGSNTICVDKTRVQTKQDLGYGTCGPC